MSFERANEHKIVWIKDEDLLDNPRNHVDTEYTEDMSTDNWKKLDTVL